MHLNPNRNTAERKKTDEKLDELEQLVRQEFDN